MDPAVDTAASRLTRPTLTGVVALVAAAALIVFLAVRGQISLASSEAIPPPRAAEAAAGSVGPIVLTARELRARARVLGQPVFWVGPRQGRAYELNRTTDARVSVRYVSPGATPGAADNEAIVVGTYPSESAYAKARQAAQDSPTLFYRTLADGGFAVYDPDRPSSVYVAYPKLDYQVEVFDPLSGEAQELVLTGKLERVR